MRASWREMTPWARVAFVGCVLVEAALAAAGIVTLHQAGAL